MPLPKPAPRNKIHDRQVNCSGYHRNDGLWDIEGHLVDTKTYNFSSSHRGEVPAGQPVHEMWLRLTIDDDLLIHDVQAAMVFHPYRICPHITVNFQRLKGLKIGYGFRRKVAKQVGTIEGCVHMQELLGPIATTAFQTMAGHRYKRSREDPEYRPAFLNTCHAHASTSVVVKEFWPHWYTGPEEAASE